MFVIVSQSFSELQFSFSCPSLRAEPSSVPVTGKINQFKARTGVCPVWSGLV